MKYDCEKVRLKPVEANDKACTFYHCPLDLANPNVPLVYRMVLLNTKECGTCGHFPPFHKAIVEDIAAGRLPKEAISWGV